MPDPGPFVDFAKDPDVDILTEAFASALGLGRKDREEMVQIFREVGDDFHDFLGLGSIEDQAAERKRENIFKTVSQQQLAEGAERGTKKALDELDKIRVKEEIDALVREASRQRFEVLDSSTELARDVGMIDEAEYLDRKKIVQEALDELDRLEPGRGKRALLAFARMMDRVLPSPETMSTHADPSKRLEVLLGRGRGSRAKLAVEKIGDLYDRIPKQKALTRGLGFLGFALGSRDFMASLRAQLAEREAARGFGDPVSSDPGVSLRDQPMGRVLPQSGSALSLDPTAMIESVLNLRKREPVQAVLTPPAIRGVRSVAFGGVGLNTAKLLEGVNTPRQAAGQP